MRRLRIILIAHDGRKTDLVEWTRFNAGTLCRHELIATAATGDVIRDIPGLTVRTLLHGPAGGDAQAGALIATGEADVLVFFWEPLEVQPHDVDAAARGAAQRADRLQSGHGGLPDLVAALRGLSRITMLRTARDAPDGPPAGCR